MTVNLAVKYASKLDQPMTHASYTDNWVNKKYDFDGVKTVNVYTVTTVDPVAYDRTATGDRFGGNNEVQNIITPYTLTKDECFKLTIDEGNYLQGARAEKAGEVMNAQIRERIMPRIDKDRLAVASAGATAVSQAFTATTDMYQDILKCGEALDEKQFPLEGRCLFVTPNAYTLIKTAITTNIYANDYNDKLLKKGFVGELDGVPVIKVPTSYFPAGVKAVMWHRDALLGARQLTETKIITDSELVSGSVLRGRYIYGAFVLKGKEYGVATVVDGSAVSS